MDFSDLNIEQAKDPTLELTNRLYRTGIATHDISLLWKVQTQKIHENHTTKRRISSKPKFHVIVRGGRGHGDNRRPHICSLHRVHEHATRPAPAAWAREQG